jgi:hypothetical protein
MRNGRAAMTKGERDDLIKLIKQRERVQKAAAEERSKELLADFERHLGTIFKFDCDEVWKVANDAAHAAVDEANEKIRQRSKELGIPQEFAPNISWGLFGGWQGRGENASKARRDELRKMGMSRILAMEAKAKAQIAATSVELQTQIVSSGLTSEAARKFLVALPEVRDLMQPIDAVEIEKLILEDKRY